MCVSCLNHLLDGWRIRVSPMSDDRRAACSMEIIGPLTLSGTLSNPKENKAVPGETGVVRP